MKQELRPGAAVAVIGGGVAGIVAAYLLSEKFQVTLFEAGNYLGGHTNTVLVPDERGEEVAVDTGFIVLNDQTYPSFHEFLRRLGVAVRYSNMSFGFFSEISGDHYAGTGVNGLFSRRRNIVDPSFYAFLLEIRRFCRIALQERNRSTVASESIEQFVQRHKFSQRVVECYLYPIAAAIWSTPRGRVAEFPAKTLIEFFRNHGLLSIHNRPRWQTVVGGSQSYVRRFTQKFSGSVKLGAQVRSLTTSSESRCVLSFADGSEHQCDAAVVATHADQALALLSDATELERELLGAWRYEHNHTILHYDEKLLAPEKRAWASWNFLHLRGRREEDPLLVSYHMNRLQGLSSQRQFIVTLGGYDLINEEKILAQYQYTHPLYDMHALKSQDSLHLLNNQSWNEQSLPRVFAGSYFGYGFHEDAVKAGEAAAMALGAGGLAQTTDQHSGKPSSAVKPTGVAHQA